MDRTPQPRCGAGTAVAGWADVPGHAHAFQPDGIHRLRAPRPAPAGGDDALALLDALRQLARAEGSPIRARNWRLARSSGLRNERLRLALNRLEASGRIRRRVAGSLREIEVVE